jgi:hypothetical protein
MKRRARFAATLGFAAAFSNATTALAEQNAREVPIGGRTATMGGAGTAAGNDSAMPYLNPAGIAGVPGDIFAISATIYSYTHRSYEDYFYPNGTPPMFGFELENESFSTASIFELPSSVMYMNHLSPADATLKHFVGVSLIIPSARHVELVASASGNLENIAGESVETSSLNMASTTYYIGPSYAGRLGDGVRFGASLYAAYYRSVASTASTSSISLLGGSTTVTQSGQNAQVIDAVSIAPIVGAQFRLFENFWAGVGFAAPSMPIAGRLRFNSDVSGLVADPTTGAPQADSMTTTLDADYWTAEPLRLNVGVAYDNRKALSFAGDVHFYASRQIAEVDGVQLYERTRSDEIRRRYGRRVNQTAESEPIIDFSIGAEAALNAALALRAGAFSDLASSPVLTESLDDVRRLRLNRYGATLGLGITFGTFDTTIGGVFVRGEGEYGAADTWISEGVVPIRATETTAMLVLSGATTEEEAKKTIRETLPFETPVLPDLGTGGQAAPVPKIPAPLPPEQKPPPPPLKSAPAPAPSVPPPAGPTSPSPPTPTEPTPTPAEAPR